MQPGIGIDVPFSNSIAARAAFDYRRIFFKHEGTNEIRVAVGVVGFESR